MRFHSVLGAVAVAGICGGSIRAADGFFDSKGVKIRYVVEGAGTPVVLIHGWMGDSSMWGRDWLGNTKLDVSNAKGFRCVAIDCRGHGKSDKPHDPSKYGQAMADDVVRLLDHLEMKKAHFVGYSMGAYIVGNVAAYHPERVLSAFYGGQAPLVVEARSAPKSNEPSEVEVFARCVDEGKDLGAYLLAVMPRGKTKLTPEQASSLAKYMFAGKDVKALAAAGRSFGGLEVDAARLKRCKAPTLFLHGGNESDAVKNHVASVRKVLGSSELKLIEGGDHITTLTKPAFGASLMDFLRKAEAEHVGSNAGK